jgi:cyclopropane-fatty-acyl-phospholipid synthase
MFEHMRNYALLFERVASWRVPDGKFFMHIFCHRNIPYAFVDSGPVYGFFRPVSRYRIAPC